MKRLSRPSFLLACAAMWITACGGTETTPNPDPNQPSSELRSELSRVTHPDTSNVQALTRDNRRFAFELYQLLRQGDQENLFYSPMSISSALAMTFAGARGQTEQEMRDVMSWSLDQADLHTAFNALDLALASRGRGAQGKEGDGFKLKLANSIWGQRGYNILNSYLDTLAQQYDAGLRVLDFATDPDGARQTINQWVSDETEGKIEELLPEGSLTELTRLVLTNAIYFNAAWDETFPLEYSGIGSFTKLDGSVIDAPNMTLTHDLAYAAGQGYRAVELDYDGKEVSMVVIVPDAGQFDAIESKLDQAFFDQAVAALSPTALSLTLPKWQAEQAMSLKKTLQAMGLVQATSSVADFSGINGGVEPLWIGDVIHKARISVDEKGTEAAAATAVVMVGGSMVEVVDVNRPFIYAIRDKATGSVLFVGRVLDPLGGADASR